MTIIPGGSYLCCVCKSTLIEIPLDADPDAIALMNYGMENAPESDGLVCEDCGAEHLAAGGSIGIGGILTD